MSMDLSSFSSIAFRHSQHRGTVTRVQGDGSELSLSWKNRAEACRQTSLGGNAVNLSQPH